MANLIPGVAHVKALIQWMCDDDEGAKETMEDFHTKAPGMSHFVAAVAKLAGDDDLAKTCWRNGNRAVGAMVDSVPGVGHVKGLVHLVAGDVDGAVRSVKAATRTTYVMGGGVGGFLVGGPVGAIAGGTVGGHLIDTVEFVDSDGKESRGLYRLIEKPTDPWEYVDYMVHIGGDGLTGYSGGKVAERVIRASEIGTAERYTIKRDSKNLPKDGKAPGTEITREVYCEVKDKRTGDLSHGHNKTMRKTFQEHVPEGQNRFINKYGDPKHPDLKGRSGQTCAEAQAYHNHLGKQGASPTTQTRVNTIEVRENGQMYNIERCQNCKANSSNMGKCNTDPTGSLWYSELHRIPSRNEWAIRGGSAAVPNVVTARKQTDLK